MSSFVCCHVLATYWKSRQSACHTVLTEIVVSILVSILVGPWCVSGRVKEKQTVGLSFTDATKAFVLQVMPKPFTTIMAQVKVTTHQQSRAYFCFCANIYTFLSSSSSSLTPTSFCSNRKKKYFCYSMKRRCWYYEKVRGNAVPLSLCCLFSPFCLFLKRVSYNICLLFTAEQACLSFLCRMRVLRAR